MMTEEEIETEGLRHVIPKRRQAVRRNRKITIRYLQQKKNQAKWLKARRPGARQQKRMLALAVSFGVKVVLSNHTYKVGDTVYHQTAGGPIGLELTGALSRPFMMRWDKQYLARLNKVGVKIPVYERFVDDSNQVVAPIPEGSKYDTLSQKIVQDGLGMNNEDAEARTVRILKEIANTIQPGIIMEEDSPRNHANRKVPILDMEVWSNDDGYILYQHFEKPMASRQVLNAKSAQSESCKRNVHVQELVRRMLNCSTKLNWQEYVAPFLTDYMARLLMAGYNEHFRRRTLEHALGTYDKLRYEDEAGTRPLNRPDDWNMEERRKQKKKRRHNWATKGGHVAPIFVPPSPNGELARSLREIANHESEAGVKFKIIETGGKTIASQVQLSNPTATPGCDRHDCLPCQTGRGMGGNCSKSNIVYAMECQLCPDDSKCVYLGESARNLYSRTKEHLSNYSNRKPKSFILKHQQKKHNGQPGNFNAKVIDSYSDCLSRQVSEGVRIRRCDKEILNSKTEWHQPPLWRVQADLMRG